jgi:hypothetical protein
VEIWRRRNSGMFAYIWARKYRDVAAWRYGD